ncbi:unnamed protein product [Linum trigynum]
MAMNMSENFDKYWSEVHSLMGVGAILDSRYRTKVMDCYFSKIYGGDSKVQKEKLISICRKLVEDYEEKEREQDKVNDGVPMDSSGAAPGKKEASSKLAIYASRRKRKPTRSELDCYLEDGIIPNTPYFDVLCW